jgi:endonuclease/exonuclease/phosphatase family metal-dependent hydrolase
LSGLRENLLEMQAVTVNLGCGGPHPARRPAAMTDWALVALDKKPGFVFAQEVPSDPSWIEVWTANNYKPIRGIDRRWRTCSMLLVHPELAVEPLTEADCPNFYYHGNYVAAGLWETGAGSVVVASVHASPTPVKPRAYGWRGHIPKARYGGNKSKWANWQLWDSDCLLDTLIHLAGHGLIAAGDYNEWLTGDPAGVTWAEEYLDRMSNGGLTDRLLDIWGVENPTRFPLKGRGESPVQLDHVLVDRVGATLIPADPPPHAEKRTSDGVFSDHAPVWFEITSA